MATGAPSPLSNLVIPTNNNTTPNIHSSNPNLNLIIQSSLAASVIASSSSWTQDAPQGDEIEELIPCENINFVAKGIYRSAFPKKKNFPFLKKLGLKSVLYVMFPFIL